MTISLAASLIVLIAFVYYHMHIVDKIEKVIDNKQAELSAIKSKLAKEINYSIYLIEVLNNHDIYHEKHD